jgi:hypothetical protein
MEMIQSIIGPTGKDLLMRRLSRIGSIRIPLEARAIAKNESLSKFYSRNIS